MSPLVVVAVLVAGVIGALTRYGVSLAFAQRPGFPWAVLVVNVVASAIGGVVLGLVDAAGLSPEWRLVLLTGLAGGLSTFSTWSVETVQLVQSGRWRTALSSVLLNLVVGIAVATLGYLLVSSVR
jgi:CrcB protein